MRRTPSPGRETSRHPAPGQGRPAAGSARFRGEGGGRAVATNIPVDFSAGSGSLAGHDHLDLRCGPEEARERLGLLAEIGFDDAVVTVTDLSADHMAAVRALLP